MMLFSLAVAAATAAAQEPVPIDASSWIRPSDMTRSLRRQVSESRVDYRLGVDERGLPTGCEIVSSSGSQELDERTCGLLIERARFRPTRDPEGRALASEFESAVVWRTVARGALTTRDFAPSTDRITLLVAPDGRIEECRSQLIGTQRWGRVPPQCDGAVGRSRFYTAALPQQFGTLIISNEIAAPGYDASAPEGAVPLAGAVAELSFRADGRYIRCTVVERFGDLEMTDLCRRYPQPESGRAPAQRWVHRYTIYGVPREAQGD